MKLIFYPIFNLGKIGHLHFAPKITFHVPDLLALFLI